MAITNLPFANGFYVSDSLPLSAQQAINCYPSIPQAPALNEENLFATPGIQQLVANQGAGNEANRGAHVMGGVAYFVNGQTLYRLDRTVGSPDTFDVTDLGTIAGSGRVSMADNGTQLCILVPGGNGYILTEEASYGSSLVTNGDFDEDANWSKDPGWAIAYGKASVSGAVTDAELSQVLSITVGKKYKLTYTVTVDTPNLSFEITPSVGGVSGTTVNAAGTYSEIVTATSSGGVVFSATTSASAGSSQAVASIDNVVVQEETSATLTEITDEDFTANGNPQHVVFIDGYFVFTTDSKKFIVSGLNDGLVYNALDFGSAEADPDDIVCPIVFRNQLFIAGSQTIEAFQNIGGADFPFQRTGVFIEKGVSAQFAAIPTNQTFMFLGAGENESPAVWELQGSGVRKVSTTAIDSVLQGLTSEELTNVFAWSYAQKGAYFIGFTLPSTTLVYDTISGRWHERQSYYGDAPLAQKYRVNSVVQAYGKVLVGDYDDGRIGWLDPDTYTEYGEQIVRRFTTQPFISDNLPMFVAWLELTIESGVGDTTTTDPQVTMYRSKDGKTWSMGRARSMGASGEYTKRCIWRRLGRVPRFEVFRFDMSDPVKFVAIKLTADIEVGQ